MNKAPVRRLWINARRRFPDTGGESCEPFLAIDGRIAAEGHRDALRERFGDPDETIDLRGRVVLPGLTDAHCHLVAYGMEATRSADLGGAASFEEMADRLSRHTETCPGEWILGHGFDQERLRERRFPHRDEIDALIPNRPVMITRVCCHALVAGTEAMRRAGVWNEDGLFTEDAMSPLLSALPSPTSVEYLEASRRAVHTYNDAGFTTAHVLIGHAGEVRALQELARRGELSLRLRLILPHAWIDSLERTGVAAGFGSGLLRIAALKSFMDGSLGARTAALTEPYADDPSTRGQRLLASGALIERLRRAGEAGYPATVHAIGDDAIEETLRAVSGRGRDVPLPRIEHASVLRPDQRERMGAFGMYAAVQPQFIRSDFWTPDRLGPRRAAWAYPFRSMLTAGIILAGSTDCPVERPSAAAVADGFLRRADGRDTEALSALQTLQALTTHAARSIGDEEPTLRAGAPADFTILAPDEDWPPRQDPLRIDGVVVDGRPAKPIVATSANAASVSP